VRVRAGSALLLSAIALLLVVAAPPWPDDWDGLGFVASIAHFDLAHFAPHPPGYPVYVALLRVASAVTPSPMAAANAVAAISVVIALAALGACARALVDDKSRRAAMPVTFVVVLSAPLVFRTGSAVGSEAPALACAALALWGIVRADAGGALLTGLMVGLGLGVRVSWAPLFLPMVLLVPRKTRLRACAAAGGAALAWAVPFVAIVGPASLAKLVSTHVLGHASRWGGTALTEPTRVRYLARDLFCDGLGAGLDPLGIAIAVVGVAAGTSAVLAWRTSSWKGGKAAAMVLIPYFLWISVGQNLREQPRHALPIVVATTVGLALAAVSNLRARIAVAGFVALMGARTAGDARDRLRIPPPGAQLVELVRSLPDSRGQRVYGGASVRFFEPTELAVVAMNVGDLGDVLVDLGRRARFPMHVLVTSEVSGLDASPYPLIKVATLSRPERIDRHAPTLEVYELPLPIGSDPRDSP
jgi:hypothetical protein